MVVSRIPRGVDLYLVELASGGHKLNSKWHPDPLEFRGHQRRPFRISPLPLVVRGYCHVRTSNIRAWMASHPDQRLDGRTCKVAAILVDCGDRCNSVPWATLLTLAWQLHLQSTDTLLSHERGTNIAVIKSGVPGARTRVKKTDTGKSEEASRKRRKRSEPIPCKSFRFANGRNLGRDDCGKTSREMVKTPKSKVLLRMVK